MGLFKDLKNSWYNINKQQEEKIYYAYTEKGMEIMKEFVEARVDKVNEKIDLVKKYSEEFEKLQKKHIDTEKCNRLVEEIENTKEEIKKTIRIFLTVENKVVTKEQFENCSSKHKEDRAKGKNARVAKAYIFTQIDVLINKLNDLIDDYYYEVIEREELEKKVEETYNKLNLL